MTTFNIIAGLASIIGLIVAIFAAKYIINKRSQNNKINQTAIGNKNKQKIDIFNKQ